MGPAATADFLAKLVRATPVEGDWDHIPVIVRSFPQIPNRSDAILHGGESPLPAMLNGVRWLAATNVDAIAIPCNTAHYWYRELQDAVDVPIFHIADAVCAALRRRGIGADRMALFATPGTLKAMIFEEKLRTAGSTLLPSDPIDVEQIDAAIRAVKAGQLDIGDSLLREVSAREVARGTALILLGCTELPLLPSAHSSLYLDATEALAQFCVTRLRCLESSN